MSFLSGLRRACALGAACAVISGCAVRSSTASSSGGSAASAAGAGHVRIVDLATLPGNTFDVTYKPDTVVIEPQSTYESFVGMTPDGQVFAFDANDAAVAAIKAGSVVLFKNFALVKVDDVDTRDGFTLLHVEPAALTDAIDHGDIAFTQHVDFGSMAAARAKDPVTALLEAGATPALADGAAGPAGAAFAREGEEDGWHYKASATPNGARLDVALSIDKTIDQTTLNVNGAGYLQSFDAAGSMHVDGGAMQSFGFSTKNLVGEMNIDWTAKKNDKATVATEKDKPPKSTKSFYDMPVFIGGIPFVLSINAKYLVRPAMSGSDEVAHSEFHMAYNGTSGFSLKKQTVAPDGSISATQEITASNAVSIAPMGLVVGVAMPRISFGLSPSDAFEMLEKASEEAAAAAGAAHAGPVLHKVEQSQLDRAAEALKNSTMGAKLANLGHTISNGVKDYAGNFVRETNSGVGVKQDMGTGAEAYVEAVLVGTVTHAGETGMVPCTYSTLDTSFKLGVEATLFGQEITDTKTEPLFDKTISKAEPDIPMCHRDGKVGS